MTSFSLFTGAGGLDYGLEAAGYINVGCVEIDKDARRTIEQSRPGWTMIGKGDIFTIAPGEILAEAKIPRKTLSLLHGGPPCQPFSMGGLWSNKGCRGLKDPRAKTIMSYMTVLEELLPEVFLLENVKGLISSSGTDVLRLIRDELRNINKRNQTDYDLTILKLNAAEYGVPQFRERVFLVGHRRGQKLTAPRITHQDPIDTKVTLQPWRTAWDAIGGMLIEGPSETLSPSGKWGDLLQSIPEGSNYLWHTPEGRGEPIFGWRTRYWNFLLKLAKNKPSWTLQASPGPATGPFHWDNRLLSISELASLQTFPKNVVFAGGFCSARKQIGNAVPSALAEVVGREIAVQFFGMSYKKECTLIPPIRPECPLPNKIKRVPKKYLKMREIHSPHPGKGLGPKPRTQNIETTNKGI